ncbi:MAG: NIPSNAP family protein [Gammaproteobacteria bacterium]|nr:NIPSNAP family protein [Gammaproteobacteria bacterium]
MSNYLKIAGASLLSLVVGLGAGLFITISAQDQKLYELRIYKSTEGNLGNLNARFRDHTLRIFEKHGMENIGYWTPTSEEERDDTLVYIIAHDSQEAADASWGAFIQDPEWAEVAEASNANGQILAGIERKFMVATDYSPLQ